MSSQDRPRITFVVPCLPSSNFLNDFFLELGASSFDLEVIIIKGRDGTRYPQNLEQAGYNIRSVSHHGRYLLPITIIRLWYLFRKTRPNIIHTHFLEPSIVGLIAGWLARVQHRIYTRHHGNEHHLYHPTGVLIDRLINHLATGIICPSKANRDLLTIKENVPATKLRVIHHGRHMQTFAEKVSRSSIELDSVKDPVIGVISRYVKGKGLPDVIKAFQMFLKKQPDALLLITKSEGAYSEQVRALLSQLPSESVLEKDFELDLKEFYKALDVYVHAPENPYFESFGLTYVESLAAGVPSIFTISGICAELAVDHQNALVVEAHDPDGLVKAMEEICSDQVLRSRLIRNGREYVMKRFTLDRMVQSYLDYYRQLVA